MILDHENQNVHSLPEFLAFCKLVSLQKTLLQYCKAKSQGVSSFKIFQTLFFIVFHHRNFWRLSINGNSFLEFGRDTAYRFLSSPYHNWRGFLSRIARHSILFLSTLTSEDKRRVFVVDDSIYNKNRSKKLELLSSVHDHVVNRCVRGFRFLTLAFTDGISLVPLDFALLGSKKILCEANPDIDKRSHGSKRRREAISEAPHVLLSMLDNARGIIREWSYIVFDSWFCVPALIRKLAARNLHVTGRLKNDKTRFLFRRNGKDTFFTLEQLFGKLRKIPSKVSKRQRQTPDILGSLCVALPVVDENEKPLPVKIVFLKNRNSSGKKNWLAILTTDLKLSEEAVIRMYAKRWKIEEFFKVTKSLLHLEHEFQGRSYDMLIAHTTLVCTRYIFLELERRAAVDVRTCGELFYHCCDEIADLKPREAIALIIEALEAFLGQLLPYYEKCLKDFISTLPAPALRLFSTSACGS